MITDEGITIGEDANIAKLRSLMTDVELARDSESLFRLTRQAEVWGALAVVIVASWAYLLSGAGGHVMATPHRWSLTYAVLIFVMWVVMMVAMMLPSAAPTVRLVTALASERTTNPRVVPATALLFVSGYLLVWSGFSLAATLLQWGLEEARLLSETMAFGDATSAGAVFVAVGLYEWTPLKDSCLSHCHSPSEFLVVHWRQGTWGAVLTGIRHGIFCLGCCWMLMALLLVGGLMNVAWVAAITLLVLLEKTTAWGRQISLLMGALFIQWGLISLIRAGFSA